MSFTHRSSQRFKDLLKALSMIAEEVEFTVNPDGLTARQMDPSHCAMFDLKMPSAAFEKWDVIDEQKFTVDVANLVRRILKNTYKDESVEISIDPDRARLDFTLRGSMVRRKDVPILEPTDEEVPQPKIFFKAHARLVLKGMINALKDFHELSEHATVSVENNTLTFSQRGDLGAQNTPFEKYSDNMIDLKYEEDSRTTLTISYLENIMKAIQPLSEAVNLEFATDMPIKICPELEQGCALDFYLAPCIGVDDSTPTPEKTEEPTETEEEEEAYKEQVTGVIQPEELPNTAPTETPTELPTATEPAPTPLTAAPQIMIDMSILRRIKL